MQSDNTSFAPIVCVCACVRACMRACVRVCVGKLLSLRMYLFIGKRYVHKWANLVPLEPKNESCFHQCLLMRVWMGYND